MKKIYAILTLLVSLFSLNYSYSQNPQIAVILQENGSSTFGSLSFDIIIKNIGDEPLSNIDVFDYASGLDVYSSTIVNLNPGEEVYLSAYGINPDCEYWAQVQVYAETIASTTISDLSGNTYYDDNSLYVINIIQEYTILFDGEYQDLNNNNIVDVGDAIYYTFEIQSLYMGIPKTGQISGTISCPNITITNPTFNVFVDQNTITPGTFETFYQTDGIHYLTNSDVSGNNYVYNSINYTINSVDFCYYSYAIYVQDPTPCGCTIPSGYNLATQLNPLLPNKISGTTKYDTNNDNCTTGNPIRYARVNANDGTYNYATFSNSAGNYEILIPNTGTFLTTSTINSHFISNPLNYSITSAGENINYTNSDFCFSSLDGFTDLDVTLLPIDRARPGFNSTYKIQIRNNGSTVLNGDINLSFDQTKISFLNANPVESASTPSTLTWNYSNLLPFEKRWYTINFNVFTPPTVNVNDILTFTATGTTLTTDNVLGNNSKTINQTVVGSYDPNDITALEGDAIQYAEIDNFIHYLVRFQNTGSAEAVTVVVKQDLDSKLDWDTFEPIESSHTSHIQLNEGNKLIYTFSNINLPDSTTDEPNSHGWLLYRIKPKNTSQIGDIFNGTANIYFDYNLPITTNTASTEVVNVLENDTFSHHNISLYPIPCENQLSISSTSEIEKMAIFTSLGQYVKEIKNSNTIDVANLKSGYYIVKITTNNKEIVKGFIKR